MCGKIYVAALFLSGEFLSKKRETREMYQTIIDKRLFKEILFVRDL